MLQHPHGPSTQPSLNLSPLPFPLPQGAVCEVFTVSVYNPSGSRAALSLSDLCQQNVEIVEEDGTGAQSTIAYAYMYHMYGMPACLGGV
jgi:hypothetical protein